MHVRARRQKEPGPWHHAYHTSLVCPSVGFYSREKKTSILLKTLLYRFFLLLLADTSLMWYKVLKNLYSITVPCQVGQDNPWVRFISLLIASSVFFLLWFPSYHAKFNLFFDSSFLKFYTVHQSYFLEIFSSFLWLSWFFFYPLSYFLFVSSSIHFLNVSLPQKSVFLPFSTIFSCLYLHYPHPWPNLIWPKQNFFFPSQVHILLSTPSNQMTPQWLSQ